MSASPGSNAKWRSSVSRVTFAQMEAAETTGKSRSALAFAKHFMPVKRSFKRFVYSSASPTVSTYTSATFTPASSAAWGRRGAGRPAVSSRAATRSCHAARAPG